MTKTIFLHIGLPKTGTTFLQWQIEKNREFLKKNGIYVPRTGQDLTQDKQRDHNLLVFALQSDRWGQFPYKLQSKLPSIWSELVTEIKNCQTKSVLISSEIFSWELKTCEQINLIRDYFLDFNVKIIYCERDPYDFIPSMYGQMIKTGRSNYSLDDFLKEFPYYWDTAFQTARWIKVFGEKNLVLLKYEDIKGDLILNNFLNKVFKGQIINIKNLDIYSDVNYNLSLSPRALRFIEELNFNGINSTPIVELLELSHNNYVRLENDLVSISNVSLSLKNYKSTLNECSPSIFPLDSDKHGAHPNYAIENLNKSLAFAKAELSMLQKELVENRQLLVTRTKLLERTKTALDLASRTLKTRTQELVVNRQELLTLHKYVQDNKIKSKLKRALKKFL